MESDNGFKMRSISQRSQKLQKTDGVGAEVEVKAEADAMLLSRSV